MTTFTAPAGRIDDTSIDRAMAAHGLVHFRDGVMATLLNLARLGKDLDTVDRLRLLAPVLAVFPLEDCARFADRIDRIALDAFHGDDRPAALGVLRKVCLDIADQIAREVRRDACLCREVPR